MTFKIRLQRRPTRLMQSLNVFYKLGNNLFCFTGDMTICNDNHLVLKKVTSHHFVIVILAKTEYMYTGGTESRLGTL